MVFFHLSLAGKRLDFEGQLDRDTIEGMVASGEHRIMGVMIESNLVAGRQDVRPGAPLTYGQSITDGCIDWETTVPVLTQLADAVAARRTTPRNKVEELSA